MSEDDTQIDPLPGFTVGQLREALVGLPDHMEIVVRTEDEDGNSFCGGITSASAETSCGDDFVFFAIDARDVFEEETEVVAEGPSDR